MAFGIRKFRVRAQVMRREDGSPTKVSIIPTRSLSRKKAKKELEEAKKAKKATRTTRAKKVKRKTRAPRS